MGGAYVTLYLLHENNDEIERGQHLLTKHRCVFLFLLGLLPFFYALLFFEGVEQKVCFVTYENRRTRSSIKKLLLGFNTYVAMLLLCHLDGLRGLIYTILAKLFYLKQLLVAVVLFILVLVTNDFRY